MFGRKLTLGLNVERPDIPSKNRTRGWSCICKHSMVSVFCRSDCNCESECLNRAKLKTNTLLHFFDVTVHVYSLIRHLNQTTLHMYCMWQLEEIWNKSSLFMHYRGGFHTKKRNLNTCIAFNILTNLNLCRVPSHD